MPKKSRIIQIIVTMILKQSIRFIGSLKYSNGFDLHWRNSQTTRALFIKKKITRSNNLMILDISGISDNDVSVKPKSTINKMLFIDMRKE